MKPACFFDTLNETVPLQEAALTGLLHACAARMTADADAPASGTALSDPVILCIGTDRLIGDSLGPIVGTLLERCGCPFPVYGTLSSPVHALNLDERTAKIRTSHPHAPVIAVDASLGPDHRIGCVSLRPRGLQPGAGVHKKLPCAGDISITGVTGADSLHPYLALQTARLSIVMTMAEEICRCIMTIKEPRPRSSASGTQQLHAAQPLELHTPL